MKLIYSCVLRQKVARNTRNAFVNFENSSLILHILGISNTVGRLASISIVFCLRKIRRLKEDYKMNMRRQHKEAYLISQLLRFYIKRVLCFCLSHRLHEVHSWCFPKVASYLRLRENFNGKQEFWECIWLDIFKEFDEISLPHSTT